MTKATTKAKGSKAKDSKAKDSKAKNTKAKGRQRATVADLQALGKTVADRKDNGESIKEIAADLGMHVTRVTPLYDIGKVKAADRVKAEPTSEAVTALRDDTGLSWSEIAGRYVAGGQAATIATVKALYTGKGPKRKPAAKAEPAKAPAKAKAKANVTEKGMRETLDSLSAAITKNQSERQPEPAKPKAKAKKATTRRRTRKAGA